MSAFGFGVGLGLRQRRTGGVALPAAASAITALVVQGVTDLDPDGGGIGIDGNGWVAKAVLPFDAAASFDPTKIVLTVSDPGFASDGSATTRTRTIRGGAILRRQYPNQADFQSANVAGNLEVYFSLDDDIFAGSAITAAEAEAGYYGDDAAGTIAGVVNSSARAYPKPLFAWLNAQQDRATGATYAIEAVAYHRMARLGQQVACIEFTATDASLNTSAVQRASAPALSDFQTKGNIVEAWKASIPLTALTQGEMCTVAAVVKPWIGEAWDLAVEGIAWPTAQTQTLLRFLCDKTGGYGGAIACVKAGAVGGTVQTDLATARTTPFPTIIAARTAIGTWNGSNKGHADLGGADIYLMDDGAGGAVNHGFAAGFGGTAGLTWLNVRADPANTALARAATTGLVSTPSLVRWYCDMLSTGANASFHSSTASGSHLASYDGNTVTYAGTGGAVPIHYQFGLVYLRNVTYSGIYHVNQSPFRGFSTLRQQTALALGCVSSNNTAGLTVHPFAFIGCTLHLGALADVDPAAVPNYDALDGLVVANNKLTGLSGPSQISRYQPIVRGAALVQNLIESKDGSIQPALNISSEGGSGIANVIDQHNSVVGARMNRAYADIAEMVDLPKQISGRANIWFEYNCKSDTYTNSTTSTGRVGNWRSRYMVGHQFNVCLTGAQNVDAPDLGGGSWLGEYWPDAFYAVGTAAVGFVDDRSDTGTGTGGGDYALTGAENAAYDRVSAGMKMLAFDLAGEPRLDDGTGASGAYERAG